MNGRESRSVKHCFSHHNSSAPSHLTILYCTVLYCTLLYSTVLYSTVLYSTLLYYTILYCTILYYTILYYTILYYTILYYTILYYTIHLLYHSIFQVAHKLMYRKRKVLKLTKTGYRSRSAIQNVRVGVGSLSHLGYILKAVS